MQTMKALGTSGGGFLTANQPRTPAWIVAVLAIGFASVWTVFVGYPVQIR
jgi:hypothetical protein